MMEQADNLLRQAMRLAGFRSRHVASPVGRVHVMEAAGTGNAPPIVLVHGLSSTGAHFLPMLLALKSRTRRLILPDLPGHGLSDIPAEGTGMDTIERSLIEVLDTLVTEPSVLFGSSLGGAVASRYAVVRPSRVCGLMLSSPGGAQCEPAEFARVMAQFRMTSHAMGVDFIKRLMDVPMPIRHILALAVRYRFARPALRRVVSAVSASNLLRPEELRSLRMPAVVVWGQEDDILPRSHLDFFRRHIPHARIEEPAGVGHAPYLQAPGVLTESLLRFLDEIESAAAHAVNRSAA